MERQNTDAAPQGSANRLHRVLTLREAVALGIGGTIGGGIFVLVGAAAGRAGPGALLAFVLAFGVSMAIALPYAELACRYPLAGGGYAFARALLGPHWGFLMGWGYWGAYLFISGYVTLGFGGYLHALLGLPSVAGALALIGLCITINLIGVRFSGLVQSLVIGLAVAALLGFSLLALIALTGSVVLVAAVGGFLYVLHFLFPLAALVVLRHRGGPQPAFRTPAPRLVLPLAFVGCVLLLVTSGWIGVAVGTAWLLIGLSTYGILRIYRRA